MTTREAIALLRRGAAILEDAPGSVTMPCWDEDAETPREAAVRRAARAVLVLAEKGEGEKANVADLAMLVRYIADLLEM